MKNQPTGSGKGALSESVRPGASGICANCGRPSGAHGETAGGCDYSDSGLKGSMYEVPCLEWFGAGDDPNEPQRECDGCEETGVERLETLAEAKDYIDRLWRAVRLEHGRCGECGGEMVEMHANDLTYRACAVCGKSDEKEALGV